MVLIIGAAIAGYVCWQAGFEDLSELEDLHTALNMASE